MLLHYILTLGGIQGLILSSIIFFKKPGSVANYFLASFIFVLGLGCLFDTHVSIFSLDTYMLVWAGNSLLFSPILYLYVQFFIKPKPLSSGILFHFVCFFLIKGLLIFLHFQKMYEEESLYALGAFFNYFLILYNLLYIGLSFRYISANRRRREKTEIISLIKSLLWIFTFYNVMFFIRRIIYQVYSIELSFVADYLYIGVAIIIYVLSAKIIYQPHLLYRKEKYAKSSLAKKDITQYGLAIREYFETKKPFMNPAFNLGLLAKDLELEKHKVSQILGDYFQASFYDLLNQYRIEEVCRQLLSPTYKEYSILGIAFSCGYQSKSSFNAAFKKIKGVTPSEFINQHQIQS